MLRAIIFSISRQNWRKNVFQVQNKLIFNDCFKYFGRCTKYIYRPKVWNTIFIVSTLINWWDTAILAASGKTPIVKLSLIVFVRGSEKIFAYCFTSFGGILSTPLAFFISILFRRVAMFGFVTESNLKEHLVVFFSIISLNFVTLGWFL